MTARQFSTTHRHTFIVLEERHMKFSLHGASVRFVTQTVNARPSGASSIVHAVVELYFGISRCAQPLPRGCTGHVAHPFRSIAGSRLRTRLPPSLSYGVTRRCVKVSRQDGEL